MRFITRPALIIIGLIVRQKPVPLHFLLKVKSVSSSVNCLSPLAQSVTQLGNRLANPFLAQLFRETVLGTWSLDCDTLNFLEERIMEQKPTAILEFGSGISTVCLAHFMRTIHPNAPMILVYSIEQSAEFAAQTRQKLDEFGLADYVKVDHFPLVNQVVEGEETVCYDLTANRLKQLLGGVRPDFCLIDGPIWSTSSRLATVPQVKEFLSPGAQFFLDDALRDRELQIARSWSRLPYLRVAGVHLVGKGILNGELR